MHRDGVALGARRAEGDVGLAEDAEDLAGFAGLEQVAHQQVGVNRDAEYWRAQVGLLEQRVGLVVEGERRGDQRVVGAARLAERILDLAAGERAVLRTEDHTGGAE